MKEIKKYLCDYYEHTSQYYSQYHNHKETFAWAGLTLYILFCGLIIGVKLPNISNIWLTGALTATVLVVAVVVFFYVKNQLAMKDRGGALAAAAKALLAEIILKKEADIDANDYLSIEESADTKAQSSHVLPIALYKKADVINTRGRGHQEITKWMIYILLVLSTISVIGVRWIYYVGLTRQSSGFLTAPKACAAKNR